MVNIRSAERIFGLRRIISNAKQPGTKILGCCSMYTPPKPTVLFSVWKLPFSVKGFLSWFRCLPCACNCLSLFRTLSRSGGEYCSFAAGLRLSFALRSHSARSRLYRSTTASAEHRPARCGFPLPRPAPVSSDSAWCETPPYQYPAWASAVYLLTDQPLQEVFCLADDTAE